jgi:tyrosyl-tRNA synthetase
MNFIKELRWRGMIHDIMPGTEELLEKEVTKGYIGFDPTADSLHLGHMVQVMLLVHFQRSGHVPIALIGGATGMIGDPSGRSEERNFLDEATLRKNESGIKKQLSKFLDFSVGCKNSAIMVNNYDWMKEYSFLSFIREIGKHITVNYMMAKDSVKKRVGAESRDGMSFTEFSYQLVQGTDFLHLYNEYGCKLQMGGSDQWGNIVTGTELIRRKTGGEAYAMTSPLITKSDGTKFGKTDEDAARYIKIFTLLDISVIETLIESHRSAPHERILQKRLAEEMMVMVHSREEYDLAVEASQILFGKGTTESLKRMNENTFLSVFEGVAVFDIRRDLLTAGVTVTDLCAEHSKLFSSKGELRRMIDGGGLSINKIRIENPDQVIGTDSLLNNKYLLVQKGKKNYFLLRIVQDLP